MPKEKLRVSPWKSLKISKIAFSLLPFIIAFLFLPNLTYAQLDFQHWKTFRKSVAFALLAEWSEDLQYRYQPLEVKNYFESKHKSHQIDTIMKTPAFAKFNELGFFCTLDLKMDLTMKLPVRFRLGTLDEVNRKEGYYD